jgi:hypothetical protein
MVTSNNDGAESYMLQCYECGVRHRHTAGRGMMIACIQLRKLGYTEVSMVMLGFNDWGLQAHVTLTS